MKQPNKDKKENELVESVDFYYENGLMVLTALFHKKRGYCCGNGCRHCPYSITEEADHNKKVSSSPFGA